MALKVPCSMPPSLLLGRFGLFLSPSLQPLDSSSLIFTSLFGVPLNDVLSSLQWSRILRYDDYWFLI